MISLIYFPFCPSHRHVSLLEAKVNAKLEETNNLLREILKREYCKGPKRRQLTHQKETLNEEENVDVTDTGDTCPGGGGGTTDDYYSLLGTGDACSSKTFGGSSGLPSSPAASSATRVLNLASKLVPRPMLRAAKSVTEPSTHGTHDSPREYSELTMTLDYEELKSSTLSTDDEDTNRDEASLRLNVLTTSPSNLNRALSLQLPEPEPDEVSRGVLRQTHSDSKDPDVDNV